MRKIKRETNSGKKKIHKQALQDTKKDSEEHVANNSKGKEKTFKYSRPVLSIPGTPADTEICGC